MFVTLYFIWGKGGKKGGKVAMVEVVKVVVVEVLVRHEEVALETVPGLLVRAEEVLVLGVRQGLVLGVLLLEVLVLGMLTLESLPWWSRVIRRGYNFYSSSYSTAATTAVVAACEWSSSTWFSFSSYRPPSISCFQSHVSSRDPPPSCSPPRPELSPPLHHFLSLASSP
ncbi:unnamed protein product [Closterium sp. NIES-53]